MLKKICLITLFCLCASNGFAKVGIFPQSLYFDANSKQKSQTVTVINETPLPQAYQISVKDYEPDGKGQMKKVEKTANSAKDFIMFSPKRFTLPPKKTQNVRVAIRKTSEAKDGEYSSFLHVSEIENNFGKKQEAPKDQEGVSFNIKMYMATAIPVTIAKGDLVAQTDVLGYKQKGNMFEVELQRKGTKSSRVNVVLLDADKKEIGRANGVVIKKPDGKRTIGVKLKETETENKPTFLKLEDAITNKEIVANFNLNGASTVGEAVKKCYVYNGSTAGCKITAPSITGISGFSPVGWNTNQNATSSSINVSTNINISERKREISTLKVLGFYNEEVDSYITRENYFITIIGIALGIFLGGYISHFVIKTCEPHDLLFLKQIKTSSYIISAIIASLFTMIVSFITHHSLKKIDMIESLKNNE